MRPIKLTIDPALKELELAAKHDVATQVMGKYKSVFKGRGLEFDSYKNYTTQDDASLIDWKASMRANNLLLKQFVEERNLSIYFLVDVSDSMLLGSGKRLKNEYAASLAASIAISITAANDLLGFGFLAEELRSFHPAKGGAGTYYEFTRTLVDHKNYGGTFHFDKSLRQAMNIIPERNIIILISDFLGLKGDWKKYIQLIASKYDVVGICIRDPIDIELPPIEENLVVEDPFSDQQVLFESGKYRNRYHQAAKSQIAELQSVFNRSQSDFLSLRTDKSFADPLIKLFRLRSEKWR